MSSSHSMLRRHHDEVQDLEYKHMAAIHKLRDEQMRKQHSTELLNQNEYTERQQKEMRKRHALQSKQLPKSIGVSLSTVLIDSDILIDLLHVFTFVCRAWFSQKLPR